MNHDINTSHIYPKRQQQTDTAAKPLVTFDNPNEYVLSIRASALIFSDSRSVRLYQRLEQIAPSEATALVIGETGTGKELIARQIHKLSQRAQGPFIALNCAALPESLIESELFGHVKGAFTGALQAKQGWFAAASGGTLFLDEIGDLPAAIQVKLLRVLQEREVFPVGSHKATPIDVRLIAATNVNLQEAVLAGRFREDLYYRLNVAPIKLLPLKERPGDILPLSQHFIQKYEQRLNVLGTELSQEAKEALLHYPWPGNIRELENVIHHALLVMNQQLIRPKDLHLNNFQQTTKQNAAPSRTLHSSFAPQTIAMPDHATDLASALHQVFDSNEADIFAKIEAQVFQAAFEYCHKNQLQTAKMLGISRNILRHRLKLYQLL